MGEISWGKGLLTTDPFVMVYIWLQCRKRITKKNYCSQKITFWYFWSSQDAIKALTQCEQSYPFSPVLVMVCVLNLPDIEEDFSQWYQLNGFSPVWVSCMGVVSLEFLGCSERVVTLWTVKSLLSGVSSYVSLKVTRQCNVNSQIPFLHYGSLCVSSGYKAEKRTFHNKRSEMAFHLYGTSGDIGVPWMFRKLCHTVNNQNT